MAEPLTDDEVELVRHDVAITADESFLGRFLATIDNTRAERDEALRRAEKAETRFTEEQNVSLAWMNAADGYRKEWEKAEAERDRLREALDNIRAR